MDRSPSEREGESRVGPRTGPRGERSPPAPEFLHRFVELVNRGEFWESHEVLEEPWRGNRSDFLQGLILYASAFVHAERGNRHGISAQLQKAERKLAGYPGAYLGLDVSGIREHIRRCSGIVDALSRTDAGAGVKAGSEAGGRREGRADPWIDLIPFPVLELRPERVRGNEPELE